MTPASTSTPIRIETMLYGGDSRAANTPDGRAANAAPLPFTLPGEIVQPGSNSALQILEPSPYRVAPACPHFGVCGGCQYQHAAYPAQLAIKQTILRDTLAGAGLTALPEIVPHAAEPWHYRNRIRLRLARVNGQLRAGYSRRTASSPANGTQANQEPQFLPITECPIAAPLLWRAAEVLVSLETAALDATAQRWLTAATEVELFTNADETKLQLTLFTRGQGKASSKQPNPTDPGFTKLCLALQQQIPQLTGAGIAVLPQNSDRGRRFERPKPGPQWGSPGLLYSTPASTPETTRTGSTEDFWITRGGFFQINRFLLPELARLATAGRRGTLAWDLYAGVGLFSRALAPHFQQVVAVEAAESSAADLTRALKGTPHHAVASTTLDFVNFAVLQRERPDLIVMDPPRAGVGSEVCALLARVGAPEIVYVSCDPTTLARDLAQLVASGYQLAELHLVDMFPQTFHMETVALLRR